MNEWFIHKLSDVPRSTSDDELRTRFDALVATATRVFSARGFKRTQMGDVAEAHGVSVGSLYRYVEGKEALFLACLEAASPAGPPAKAPRLPIATPSARTVRGVVARGRGAIAGAGPLKEALATDEPADVAAELAGIIGDAYDRTHASRHFQALLERSARDLPEYFEAFFVGVRRPFLDALTSYLERRIASGHLRPVPDVATTARLINECQAWFARHRFGDQDTSDVADEHARAVVIDVLVAGLLP
jgi:AcrR family transcriptional regulator